MNQFEYIKSFLYLFKTKYKRPFVVAVDFDGTLCEEAYPNIGKAKPLMLMLVKTLQDLGVYTILWTCRSGKDLENAKTWCIENGLNFDRYNEHAPFFLKDYDTCSVKVFADMYIDDKAYNAKKTVTDLSSLADALKTL